MTGIGALCRFGTDVQGPRRATALVSGGTGPAAPYADFRHQGSPCAMRINGPVYGCISPRNHSFTASASTTARAASDVEATL